MNVGLPGGGEPSSAGHLVFWLVIAAMIAGLLGMIGFFRWKRWL